MSGDKRLPLKIIRGMQWYLGLPDEYLDDPEKNLDGCFRIVDMEDGLKGLAVECEEKVLSFVQRNAMRRGGYNGGSMEVVEFPLFPSKGMRLKRKIGDWFDKFQEVPYVSPYDEYWGLDSDSDVAGKRIVGVLHEMHCLFVEHHQLLSSHSPSSYFLSSSLTIFRNWGWTRQVADLLVMNGTIYTSDSSLPFADSMAVRNGRILEIGNYSSVQVLLHVHFPHTDVRFKWAGVTNINEDCQLSNSMYTILAAEACILDIDVGSLSTGKMAYFVVMTDDLWMGFAEHGYASIAGQM
ncbi:hypothetical protein ACET3Z_018227 [Daucus carota]